MIWKEQNSQFTTSLAFKDFGEAWSFMSDVALVAEKLNHHPSWTNTYNKVDIVLSTHEAGDIITDKDRVLAEKIEEIYKTYKL